MTFSGLCRSAVLLLTVAEAQPATAKSLDIYFIDVEGGQSTLLVTPQRESLLIDTGWAGDGSAGAKPGDPSQARDARRIVAAARDAGVDHIDYVLITHFHPDHDGGVVELSKLMPIRHLIDHGTLAAEAQKDSGIKSAFDAYLEVRGMHPHFEPRIGDRLPINGIEAVVVSSAAKTITQPLRGAGELNGACGPSAVPARDPYENPRSTGIVVSYGKFRFLDVGDLSGPPLFALACPKSLIGPVDVYLVAHHGGPDVDVPTTFAAFKPRVAIMNNSLKKGGALVTFQALHRMPRLEAVWQLHRSSDAADSNFADERIANLDESSDHWIKLNANQDASFRVFNPRTGEWTSYSAPIGKPAEAAFPPSDEQTKSK
jgi:competence protein ComEC